MYHDANFFNTVDSCPHDEICDNSHANIICSFGQYLGNKNILMSYS